MRNVAFDASSARSFRVAAHVAPATKLACFGYFAPSLSFVRSVRARRRLHPRSDVRDREREKRVGPPLTSYYSRLPHFTNSMAIKKATLRKRKASEDIEQDDNVPSQVSFSAEYTSPVGPATEIIGDCDGFAKQAQSAIKRANVVISKLGQLLEGSDMPDRWTVDDLKGSVDQVYNVDMYRTELMDWHEERMVPAGFTWDDRDEEDDNSNEQQPRARKKKAKKQSSEPRLPRDPLFQSVMRQAASLEMFNTHPDMYALLRKTRSSDHNTLNELRSSLSPPEPDDSSLSSLIYDITFQPLPRYVNKAMVPTRQLHLVALGSSTLWAIRNNAHVGGDNIPVGQRVAPDSSSQNQSQNQWNVPAGDVWEWQNVRRETGSCFVIEDAVYPDDRPDVQNYAQCVCLASQVTHSFIYVSQQDAREFDRCSLVRRSRSKAKIDDRRVDATSQAR